MRPLSTSPRSVSGRLLRWTALCAVLVPGAALAHGEEALFIAFLLPVAVVPVVFLLSAWFWRAPAGVKVLTGVVLVLAGAALVGVGLLILDANVDRLRDAPFFVQILGWFGPPMVGQAAAWALIARWHRRRPFRQK